MIEKNLSFKSYQEIEAINISSLKEMRRSPAHFKAKLEEPAKETTELLLGSLIHGLILQPTKLLKEYLPVVKADRRTKVGKALIDETEARAQAEGLKIVPIEIFNEAEAVANAAKIHPYYPSLACLKADTELTLTWEQDGVACKGRLDHYLDGVITDIKTTKDASPHAFARAIYTYGYHNQAAWYLRGALENGLEVHDYIIFAIEKDPPYCAATYRLSQQSLDLATAENETWLAQYQICKERNNWYGYSPEIEEISIPQWAVNEVEF